MIFGYLKISLLQHFYNNITRKDNFGRTLFLPIQCIAPKEDLRNHEFGSWEEGKDWVSIQYLSFESGPFESLT